ncbi:MAG: 3-hydroxyacyl-CoA dehydrogenase NAD-binding domain-containing protein [Actinomycetota bacterium]
MTWTPKANPADVRTVGVIGTGVIGGGWAAKFLAQGYDVVAWDPGPDAAGRLARLHDIAWPSLERLGLADGAARDRLRVVDSLEEAAGQADVIQESGPEVLDLKVDLLGRLDAAADPGVPILSSTSGFRMTDMAGSAAHPERLVVGHPFNPPYLVPLVEVVGGELTDPAAVDWALDFYTRAGKKALRCSNELPGFVANRLQDAVWRELLHMVANGEATVEECDTALVYGPGVRWAQMGVGLTFHLAGGEGGMAHMLDHFGDSLLEPWTRLEAPPLTPELRDAMVAGCEDEAAGRSIADLQRQRDAFLVELLQLLETHHADPPR